MNRQLRYSYIHIITALWVCFCHGQDGGPHVQYRLPSSVVPENYNLQIKIDIYQEDPANFSFGGTVDILIRCVTATSSVTLHALDLTIPRDAIRIRSLGDVPIRINRVREVRRTQFLILDLAAPLVAGRKYRLSITFNSQLKRYDKYGLFYGSYRNGSSEYHMVGNMGEATYTRKIFPCFDEPALRATFNISILRKPPQKCISNMPLRTTETRVDGWLVDRFEETPNMSTYLLAFVVTRSGYMERITPRGFPIRMYARSTEMERAEFALNEAAAVLEKLEAYFGARFPLPKLDMIEIPEYPFTGLETWGAIQFQPETVLIDLHRQNHKKAWDAAKIVVHEIIHSWIGNLVTLEWWDGIWIKEGLSTFLIPMATGMAFPQWNMEGIFYSTEERDIKDRDMMLTAEPVRQTAESHDEIEHLYDPWSYKKSASLFRMVYHALGPDQFKRGVQKLVRDRAYSTVNNQILWDTFQNVSGIRTNLSSVMSEWLTKTGYPLVTVQRDRQNTGPDSCLYISAAPFNYDICREMKMCGSRWVLPITFQTDVSAPNQALNWQDVSYMCYQGSISPVPPTAQWAILNTNAGGYYRVNYDDWNWKKIMEQLQKDHTVIPELNRAQLIGDAIQINRNSQYQDASFWYNLHYVEPGTILELLSYLRHETSATVWVMVAEQLPFWYHRLRGTHAEHNFKEYMVYLAGSVYNKTGLTVDIQDPLHHRYMRKAVASLACKADSQCSAEAVSVFNTWKNTNNKQSVHADIETEVMSVGVRVLGEPAMDFVLNKSRSLSYLDIRDNYRKALASMKDPQLARRLLDRGLTISRNFTSDLIYYMSSSPYVADVAWNFIRENFADIQRLFGDKTATQIQDWLDGFGLTFDTNGHLEKLDELETALPASLNVKDAFNKARIRTKHHRAWKDRNLSVIYDWLKDWKLSQNTV